jgi:acyl carrier protein
MSGSETAGTARGTVSGVLLALLGDHLRSVPQDVDWATASLPDLGLDSMSAIELVLAIEDAYGARFPEELLVRETFATYGSLESVVRSMVGGP